MDLIVQKKKEIKEIYKDKQKTEVEKYQDIKNIIRGLSDIEFQTLKLSFECGEKANKRMSDTLQFVIFSLSVLSFVISSVITLTEKIEGPISLEEYSELVLMVGIVAVILLIMYYLVLQYKTTKLPMIQYVLGVIESVEKEEEKKSVYYFSGELSYKGK